MPRGKYRDGRSSDATFSWVTRINGPGWEPWRVWMEGWLASQKAAIGVKINAINWFGVEYLPLLPEPGVVTSFFQAAQDNLLPDLYAVLLESMNEITAGKNEAWIADFVDWGINEYFSEEDDRGVEVPFFDNPFSKRQQVTLKPTETVYGALPYSYIKELRSILCPVSNGNFRDWIFAHTLSGQSTSDGRGSSAFSDWIEVESGFIDYDDSDTVWRTRLVLRAGRNIEIHELWSPVRAVALLSKLLLPLRTYQVRMLDSGESDTWRYAQGSWQLSDQPLAQGKESNPWRRGVFSRMPSLETGQVLTGIYISTNKTADRNKDSRERGYTIPWQFEELLYWLEKLRNWQEKYNPITAPTSCTELELKHFGSVKTEEQKKQMGSFCFLFRDPTAKVEDGRRKPIIATALAGHWYKLLAELERRVAERGQALDDGTPITFVMPPDPGVHPTKTHFPLHSLRVSLITCFAMEGLVPFPVLGKLIAGHSRLLMVLHYNKISVAKMTSLMAEATAKIDVAELENLGIFLRHANLEQISARAAFNDESTMQVAMATRNPVGWDYRHLGLCLVGGNNVYVDEVSAICGCFNGGPAIPGTKPVRHERVHHGDGNCICCRFLITDASYLPQLVAHLNILSYRASLAANVAIEAEQERDELLDERYFAVNKNLPFIRHAELQRAERRYEQQKMEVDAYAKDLQYCFKLIARLLSLEEERATGDDKQMLVATGTLQDIHPPISLIETKSELWQLSVILEDAEIYPDEADELLKTPAVHSRSQQLNRLLMRNDYIPIFLNMSERMQLVAGNAMMRAMASAVSPDNRVEGFRQVSDLIEAGRAMHILQAGVEALEQSTGQRALLLKDLITMQPSMIERFADG